MDFGRTDSEPHESPATVPKGPGLRPGRAARYTRWSLAGSLALPLAGACALALSDRGYWPHATVLTWYAFLTWGLLELALRRGWRHDVFLTLASLHLFLLTPEVFLRVAGFRYQPGLRSDGLGAAAGFTPLAGDEGLFWTLLPGSPGVNEHGFKTRPLARPAGSGRQRLVFLGDSVAHQGYPEIVETLLNAGVPQAGPDGRYEVLNLSLAGYSSHQGRVLVEQYGEEIAADVAIIAYGWNDHWLARGAADSEKVVRVDRSAGGRLASALYRRSRTVQAVRSLIAPAACEPPGELRVPPPRYRQNLTFLGNYWAARGARPFFLTQPSAHRRLGVPDYLVEQGLARDRESAVVLHRSYNRIVREVAAEHGWPVLDLERELDALPPQDLARIFLADGIHLTSRGLALFAQRVAAAIAESSRGESEK